MSDRVSMDDYIDVAERIQDFKDAFPDGTLQQYSAPYVLTVTGTSTKRGEEGEEKTGTFIVYTAAAYRTPDDPRPSIGTAYERFPGPTPYTKDSELMNAETAAWGRAIVALGLSANRSLASRQEVRARVESDNQPEPDADTPKPKVPKAKPSNKPEPTIPDAEVHALAAIYAVTGWKGKDAEKKGEDPHAFLRLQLATVGAGNEGDVKDCIRALTVPQGKKVRAALEAARDKQAAKDAA